MPTRRLIGLLACVLIAFTSHPALAEGFSGAGSTFARPLLARWAQVFLGSEGEGGSVVSADAGLDYEPVGSLGGVMRVVQGAVDFGATDVPLPPEELARAGLAQFPFVSGGVAVVANIAGVPSGALRLDGVTLGAIYLGRITRWSDPAIVALNPGQALPDAPIAVIQRSDGSGTTYHFTAYLAGGSDAWRQSLGVSALLDWPVGAGAKGNQELAERVQATPNAIGYVEASQAARLRLPVVLIANRAGRFLAPSGPALQAAMASAAWDPARDFYAPLAVPTDAEAYPITATVYALMPRRAATGARARRTIAFFTAGLTEGAAEAATLGYVPLPASVAREVTAYLRALARPAR